MCCGQAMSLLQQSGMGDAAVSAVAGGQTSGLFMPVESRGASGPVKYCSVSLPDRQPFAAHESEIVERLFIVSTPESFPQSFLEDAFCRFGNMIGAYFMPGLCGAPLTSFKSDSTQPLTPYSTPSRIDHAVYNQDDCTLNIDVGVITMPRQHVVLSGHFLNE